MSVARFGVCVCVFCFVVVCVCFVLLCSRLWFSALIVGLCCLLIVLFVCCFVFVCCAVLLCVLFVRVDSLCVF